MDSLTWVLAEKVAVMTQSRSDSFEDRNRFFDSASEGVDADEDLMMEKILDNINTTPIGQVLKKISSLPEVRTEKVLDVRRQLTEGSYDLNERLDVALEKVLDDLEP